MQKTPSRVQEVSNKIRLLIDEHTLAEGRLPSEPELARQVGASRTTVRQALSNLELDGLVVRKHGVGTFVNHRVQSIRTRLEEVWDFDEMIRVSGYDSSVRPVNMTLGPATPEIAQRLSLDSGDEVLTTINVFRADGAPVIYCVDIIPAGLVRQAYRDEELEGPVYRFLERRCNQQVEYNITQVLPVIADAKLAELLDCEVGSPLHFFEEVGFNADAIPIIYSEEYYRPEFFNFRVVRKMTTHRRR